MTASAEKSEERDKTQKRKRRHGELNVCQESEERESRREIAEIQQPRKHRGEGAPPQPGERRHREYIADSTIAVGLAPVPEQQERRHENHAVVYVHMRIDEYGSDQQDGEANGQRAARSPAP